MTIEEFEIYHTENPHIYEMFEALTLKVISTGRTYFSARAIIERMRWQTQIEDNILTFKISDHPMPFYARLFEKRNPAYLGFFRKHRCPADVLTEEPIESTTCQDVKEETQVQCKEYPLSAGALSS